MPGTVQDSREFKGENDTVLALTGVYNPVIVELESIT